MTAAELKGKIRSAAQDLGFDRAGFARSGVCRDADRLLRWLEEGRHGDMEWMSRATERRTDPSHLLPGARTVISLLTFYAPEVPGNRPPPRGVSRYARGRDYHNVLGRRLRKLIRVVEEAAPGSRTIAAVDHRPVLEKEWAERAGLGWIGKHSNLITTDRGSWFLLSELVTDLELPPDPGPHAERCGRCRDCLAACPTGAIVAPYEVDARRCISYLTIERKGAIPEELRPLVGEWIFGCDVCQEVCPWNRFAVPVDEPAFRSDEGRWTGDPAELLSLDEDAFRRRFAGSPVRRAGRDGLLRNVCVALGNRGAAASLPELERARNDPSLLVREHAEWAIARIRGNGKGAEPAAPPPPEEVRERPPRSSPPTGRS